MQKRYWEERKEYWDEAGEEERQMCKGERNGEKWRLREERIRREGTKSEIQLQNHVYTCVRELSCFISSECYRLSKREDEEGETERR